MTCALPVDINAEYVDSKPNLLHESTSVPHGRAVRKLCDGYKNAADNGTWQSRCNNGTWVPQFSTCSTEAKPITCPSPLIANVTYEPIKEEYQIDDILDVTGCDNNGSSPVGSVRMRCLDDGSWYGSVKCLEYCENGVPTMPEALVDVSNISETDKHYLGQVIDKDECITECLLYNDKFVCKAVQMFLNQSNSPPVACFLLARADIVTEYVEDAVVHVPAEVQGVDNTTMNVSTSDSDNTTTTVSTSDSDNTTTTVSISDSDNTTTNVSTSNSGGIEKGKMETIQDVWTVSAFVRKCDDRCTVPNYDANLTIYTADGQTLVPNQYVLSGTTIEVECQDAGRQSMYSTCIGGDWDNHYSSLCGE